MLLVDLLRRLIVSAVNAHTQRKLKRLKSTQSQTDSIEGLELLLAPDNKARHERLRDHQEETGMVSRVEQLQAEVVRLKAALAQSESEVKRLSESEGQPAETVASTDQVNMVEADSEICEEHGYA